MHIHLSILVTSRALCPLIVAQVSAPYNRAGLTTVLRTFLVNVSLVVYAGGVGLRLRTIVIKKTMYRVFRF